MDNPRTEATGAAFGGPKRPGWWRAWFMLFFPPVSLMLVTTIGIVLAVKGAGGDRSVIGPFMQTALPTVLLINHGCLFALLLLFMRLDGLGFAAMGWRLKPADLLTDAVIGLAAGGAIYLVHQFIMTPGVPALFEALGLPTMRMASGGAPLGTSLALSLLTGIVLGGVVEEQIYRGYVLVRLTERWPAALALIPLTIGFALLHFGLGLTGMTVAGVTGLMLSALFLWRRSLVTNILAHAAVNALVLMV